MKALPVILAGGVGYYLWSRRNFVPVVVPVQPAAPEAVNHVGMRQASHDAWLQTGYEVPIVVADADFDDYSPGVELNSNGEEVGAPGASPGALAGVM